MAYGNNRNSGIPSIRTYAEALHKYDTTAPIRGRKNDDGTPKDVRPLGHRRNTWYLINKTGHGDIECIMYGTPIVTYKPNGEVVIRNYSYNTTSTANFIWDVMRYQGANAFIFDHSLIIQVNNIEQRLRCEETLTLKKDTGGNYHFAVIKPEVTHTLNRKGANIVRAKYADFMGYLANMAKLRGDEAFTRVDLENGLAKFKDIDLGRLRYSNPNTDHGKVGINAFKQFDKWISDTSENRFDGYYTAMLMLTQGYGRYNWRTSGYILDIASALHGLDKIILGLNRDECFDAKPTDSGRAKRDAYGDYFKGVWQAYHDNQA